MNGEVISVYHSRDNYDIVTRVIQLTSSSASQSCDNLFITYLYLYQALLGETPERVQNAFFIRFTSERYCILTTKINIQVMIKTVFLVVLPFLFSSKRFKPIKLNVRHLECFERDKKDIRVTYRFYVLLLST